MERQGVDIGSTKPGTPKMSFGWLFTTRFLSEHFNCSSSLQSNIFWYINYHSVYICGSKVVHTRQPLMLSLSKMVLHHITKRTLNVSNRYICFFFKASGRHMLLLLYWAVINRRRRDLNAKERKIYFIALWAVFKDPRFYFWSLQHILYNTQPCTHGGCPEMTSLF